MIEKRRVTPEILNATRIGDIQMIMMLSKTQLTTARFAVDMMGELMTATFENLDTARFLKGCFKFLISPQIIRL